ncbi:MAG: creatininase family protein [Tepidisphaeraceae bacterium]
MPNQTPWLIDRTDYREVGSHHYEVALLPWGATESHGYHLPYGTDNFEAAALADRAAEIAWRQGRKVAVLPTIPFGVQTGQLDLPFCMNLNPSTQAAILRDVLSSLAAAKVRKFVLLNAHGGNDFRQILRELQPQFPNLFLCVTAWFSIPVAEPKFEHPGDHADERETSLMLHLHPDWVRSKAEWGDGATNEWTLRALREKWAWAQRHWTSATHDTGVGDPSASTAEKGATYLKALSEKLASFLVELADADPAKLYASK